VALLNQGIEEITRRAYARLEFICESNIYSVMVSAKPASLTATDYQPLTAPPLKILFAAALTSSD
jgi:hypothetical protein